MNPTSDPDVVIRAWIADGPRELDDSLRRAVLDGALRTPQRSRSHHWRLFAALATVVVGLWAVWLLGVGPMTRIGDPDASLAPASTPRPGSIPGTVTEFVRPFAFVLPPNSNLEVETFEDGWVQFVVASDELSNPAEEHGPWGVSIADATGARTEEGLGRANLALSFPSFFEDLEGNPSFDVVAQRATALGRAAAIQGDVHAPDGDRYPAYPHIHFDWPGAADADAPAIGLSSRTRLIVADVQGRVVLVHIWTARPVDYETWLPTAMELVGSLEFLPVPGAD
jgi:hypothetical protein